MRIVPISEIPSSVVDCPEDRLPDVYQICKQMQGVCREENGAGLSAAQVGIPWRLFVIGEGEGPYRSFLNCTYSQVNANKFVSVEGCLSLRKPDGTLRYFNVDRFMEIAVAGRELVLAEGGVLKLTPFQAKLGGMTLMNIIFQHEIDHQNCVLISEIGREFEIEPYTFED